MSVLGPPYVTTEPTGRLHHIDLESDLLAGREQRAFAGVPRLPVAFNWFSLRSLFALCALSLVLHALVMALDRQATTTSNILIAVAFLFAALGCMQRTVNGPAETRILWALIASGFFLSIVGQLGSTYDTFLNRSQATALVPDFFFLIYGIPILLAISFTNAEADLKSLLWLDGAQAVLAALLIYLQIFSALPSLGRATAISGSALMNVYNVENLLLAGAVTLRLFGNSSEAKRRLYQTLAVYLCSYAAVALVLGDLELERNMAEGLQDAFWGLPCLLLLAVLAFRPTGIALQQGNTEPSNPSTALLLDNLSPVLFTLIIVIMGARIAPTHSWIGFSSIVAAVALYGVRAALLQSKFVRSQHELASSGLALMEAVNKLRDLSIRDGLTGIHNRRHFDEALIAEWKRSIRTEKPLSLLLIDVDCFKELNDRYGHPEGDECLKKIAHRLAQILRRSGDLLARYGGEEFAAILPETSMESAQLIADTMRSSIEEMRIANDDSKVAPVVTVSVGVCSERTRLGRSAEQMLSAADVALYRAKQLGRNRVQFADALHTVNAAAASNVNPVQRLPGIVGPAEITKSIPNQ